MQLFTCDMNHHHSMVLPADSLKYTSALSVGLAVVFVIITAGIAIVKLLSGSIPMPKLFPTLTDLASVSSLFTVVPVMVTSYICHYNGNHSPMNLDL